MAAFRAGNKQAADALLDLFYPELKRLAANQLRKEPDGHSWQPTLLVNELYLQLVRIKALQPVGPGGQNERAAFFALATQIMRRLLIHHARPLSSKAQKVPLWEEMPGFPEFGVGEIEDLLGRLGSVRPILRKVVEMKVFEGLTANEIAARLQCSPVSVHRYWQFSRHWLSKELSA